MSNNSMNNKSLPKDWVEGLKENFKADFTSGFIIFLLALPLSLGIAKASDVPPLMGIVTAIIGGIIVTFLTGCKLSIKGPAAGLIVIIAGAVADFGGGTIGWKMAAGAMVIAGIIQILFGVLKMGKLVDFFPLAAIHGMLAAIGLIIIAKQVPVLLNIDPSLAKGQGPIELLAHIPNFITHLNPSVAIIGAISLLIMLLWQYIPTQSIKKVPAPLVVLLFSVPAAYFLGLGKDNNYTLVTVGNILDNISINANFDGTNQMPIFIKYVIMFALVGSLESLLTVKAIDLMDPHKRSSDANKDLIAIGIGNTIAAFLGGIPMISEVARSSANVQNGAQTRWANFFHGLFLLIFAVAAYPLLEMIPNAALAAMLIAVGIKLAHPKEFIHNYHIGSEQLIIFLITIVVTLLEDLLLGIAAGILIKIIFHLVRGASLRSLFSAPIELTNEGDRYTIEIHDAAVFTNYLKLKKNLDKIPQGKSVIVLFHNDVNLIDHSVMDNLNHFKNDYELKGGTFTMKGVEKLTPVSNHPLAARQKKA